MRKIYTNKGQIETFHKMKNLNLTFYLKSLKKKSKIYLLMQRKGNNKDMNDINENEKRKIN